MAESTRKTPEPRLTLESRLGDLALVPQWLQALAAGYAIPEDVHFAIDLCLEEALSNIVRHGYGGEPGGPITVDFTPRQAHGLTFVIEDHAPPFDPLSYSQPASVPASIDDLKPGGQGIRLLRKFASSLAYERLPDGNRLTMSFALPR